MSKQVSLPVLGLGSDGSPHGVVPAGSLREASNVVIRRAGMAEPRPGFDVLEDTYQDVPIKAFPFLGDTLVVGDSGSLSWTSDPTSAIQNDDDTPADATAPLTFTNAVEARKNLYVTCNDGIRKLTGTGELTALRVHGLPVPIVVITETAGTLVPTTQFACYRAHFERVDANGLRTVGVPSGRAVYYNANGGSQDPFVSVYFGTSNPGVVAGDVVVVYRTSLTSGGVYPDDEHGEVYRYALTSTDISNGYISYTDSVATADRGAALYTNPSRGGFKLANYAPPFALVMESFRGCMFYGSVYTPYRYQLVAQLVNPVFDFSGVASGIGKRTYTGKRINASDTLTTMSSQVGLKIGMVLYGTTGSNWSGTGCVTIIAFPTGTTIQMSHTWNGATDGAAGNLTFLDSIRIDDGTTDAYYPYVTGFGSVETLEQCISTDTSLSVRHVPSSTLRAYTAGDKTQVYSALGQAVPRARIVIEEIKRGTFAAAPQIWATHGSEYFPALPEPTVATGNEFTRDVWTNRVMWSKESEPEHVPLPYVSGALGSERALILRLIATRDALWIFKQDGVWRLTGYGVQSGWRIDPFDMSLRLRHPQCAALLGDTIYAWTDQGIVALSDSGVRNISDAYIGDRLSAYSQAMDSTAMISTFGSWLSANPKSGEILCGASLESDPQSTEVFVYNTHTSAWTSWDMQRAAAAFDADTDALLFADGDAAKVYTEVTSATPSQMVNADGSYTIGIGNVSGNTVTHSTITGYTVKAGDVLTNGSTVVGAVVAVIDSTNFTASSGHSLQEDTNYTLWAGYEACLRWLPHSGSDPSAHKAFRFVSFVMESFYAISRWLGKFTTDSNAATTTIAKAETYSTTDRNKRAMVYVPANHSVRASLEPEFCCLDAGQQWRCSGVVVDVDDMSARASK